MTNRPTREGRKLLILGTRGVPALHGGFETFAEKLALYLVDRGWQVTVYCQRDGGNKIFGDPEIDEWKGIRRVTIPTSKSGPIGTMAFDWVSVWHALGEKGVPLVLGYNTAIFAALLGIRGRSVIMNMDGIEWKRAKWGLAAKCWFYFNEWVGILSSSRLVADHPEIAKRLSRRRNMADVSTIAYGADPVVVAEANAIRALGLEPGKYFVAIGRVEPENSTLELVRAYCARYREYKFVCLGKLEPDKNAYHATVIEAAKGRILFPGAIYEKSVVRSLRFHALAYCHGHTVGGTNPSLVEALGAGNPVIAHDNPFNRWVAGENALYFSDVETLDACFSRAGEDKNWQDMGRKASIKRFEEAFTWERILGAYEELIDSYCDNYEHVKRNEVVPT
jgi:glycosyltransferase involved in cell wall biosynthesis